MWTRRMTQPLIQMTSRLVLRLVTHDDKQTVDTGQANHRERPIIDTPNKAQNTRTRTRIIKYATLFYNFLNKPTRRRT